MHPCQLGLLLQPLLLLVEDGIEHSYYSYSLFNWVKGVKATPRMPVYLESQIDLIEQAIASLVPLRMAA